MYRRVKYGMAVESAANKLIPVALKNLPQKPSVSVLITCFNYGAYVGQAIDSALEQTYPPGEIIVSDDASQDNSCDVVESYISRGLPIQLLRNPHGGMAANLNAAYRRCSGDVICLLDADDTFLPGRSRRWSMRFVLIRGPALPFIRPAWSTTKNGLVASILCSALFPPETAPKPPTITRAF